MPRVLIAPAPLAKLESAFVRVLKEAGLEPVYPNVGRQLQEEELLTLLPTVDASLAGSEPYTARVLAACPNLKAIARVGVGYDSVDVAAATARGVVVTIAPGTNQEAVAEHTFALLLALTRRVLSQDAKIRAGGWPRAANLPLRGRTLGLVGLGRIGKAVAERAFAFRMVVLATEEQPDRAYCDRLGIRLVPLEQLLAESDFVSLHVPLLPQTKHLINRQTLALMKPTAFLINTARGDVIDEADLLEALTTGRLAGAGLDVFAEEPPGQGPLTKLPNVVLTAHTAGVDWQSLENMALSGAQALADLCQGKWPAEKVINPEVRQRWQWS
jgi:D-3-phosphoglycerate dehydrogenase / 2-oxoglutarate reductase